MTANALSSLDILKTRHHLEGLGGKLVWGGVVIGLAGTALGVVAAALTENGTERFLQAYLVNYCYFLSLSLGALFFVILQHLTRAGWSVMLRRVAEGVAGNLPLLALLFLPVVFGMHHIYHWAQPLTGMEQPITGAKLIYFKPVFFTARCLGYFLLWSYLGNYFLKRSVAQDSSGDPALTQQMERLSAPAMIAYAFSVTFGSFDLLMSLDPHWFSTVFGVYYFAGSVVGFFALLITLLFILQWLERMPRALTAEHYHDLGKLVFAFVIFWSYIAFSQYMLIWYGDIPEETQWYLKRQTGQWVGLSLSLIFGHFFIPFMALLSRYPKRRPRMLVIPAIWILIFHWLDIYWLVVPELSPSGEVPLGLVDAACFIGLGGLFVAGCTYRLRNCSLIPERDPRLQESVAFENA